MQRRKHVKVCLLMSVSERRWVCVLLSSGQGQVGGGRGGRGSLHVTKSNAIYIKSHTINHGQDLCNYHRFFSSLSSSSP